MAVAALMSFDTQIGQGGRRFMPKVMTLTIGIPRQPAMGDGAAPGKDFGGCVGGTRGL